MATVEEEVKPDKLDASELTESPQEETLESSPQANEPLQNPNSLVDERPTTPLNMSNEDQSLNSTLTYATAFDDNNESTGAANNLASISSSALSGLSVSGTNYEDKVETTIAQSTLEGSLNEHLSNQSDENSDVFKDTRESLERDSNTNTEADAAPTSLENKNGDASCSDADDDDDDPSRYEDSRQPEDSVHESSPAGVKTNGDSDQSFEGEDDADDENESGIPEENSESIDGPANTDSSEQTRKPRLLKHQSTNGSNSSASIDPTAIPSTKKGTFFQHDERQDDANPSNSGEALSNDLTVETKNGSIEAKVDGETAAEEAKSKSDVEAKQERKSPERWSHDKFDKKRDGAKKPRPPRNRDKNAKPDEDQAGEEKPSESDALKTLNTQKPKNQRHPREPREPREPRVSKVSESKETSTSVEKTDVKDENQKNQGRPTQQRNQGAKKSNRPKQDLSLSEYIESNESNEKTANSNRKRQENKKPDSRRSSETNEVQQRQKESNNKYAPSQHEGKREDAKPRSGRRRSDNDIRSEDRPSNREQPRKAHTEKKNEAPKNNQPRGLNPELRKRLDFSTRVQTHDDDIDVEGFEGLDNIEPVSLKITVNRNADKRTVKTTSPDASAELEVASPREGGNLNDRGPRRPNMSNKFKPSQPDHNGGQPRRADRYNDRGNGGSYNPRAGNMNRDQFEINQPNDDHHLDNLNQYQEHRYSGDHSQQQNRPRGTGRNMKNSSSKQDMGNNFSDYMPYSASSNNIDNRVPFIKTQSFSNSKLRNPNRNSNMSQQSQQQSHHQQNFSDYQPQLGSQHEMVNNHESRDDKDSHQFQDQNQHHRQHQQHMHQQNQFGMYQNQVGYREQGARQTSRGTSNQDQSSFPSNSAPFEAPRHFNNQQYHSMNTNINTKGPDFNNYGINNPNQFQYFNDQGQGQL